MILGGITFNICVVGMLFRPHIFYRNRYEHNIRINKIKTEKENIDYYNDDDNLEIEVKLLVIIYLFLIIYFELS